MGVRDLRHVGERAVRAVRRQIEKEWLPLAHRVADPSHGFVKIDASAVPLGLLGLAIAKENRIGVLILRAGRITGLTDAAATMHQGHVETLIHGSHRIAVTQVPLAKDACGITRSFKYLGHRHFGGVHHGAAPERIDRACAVVVAACHQAGPRRRANRTDVEARQDRAFLRHRVDVRSAYDRVAVHAQIAIALIVSHDQHDVGPACCLCIADCKINHECQEASEQKKRP